MRTSRIQAERIRDVVATLEGAAFALAEHDAPVGDGPGRAQLSAGIDSLDACIDLIRTRAKPAPEPIRTVHHLACTGGTIISKAIATLPNVHLLSEASPLSLWPYRDESFRFFPTDMIGLLRHGTRDVGDDLLLEVFRGTIDAVHRHDREHGRHLVIRDHAHSQFCYGPRGEVRRGLMDAIPAGAAVRSVVTVRHPLDSFSSLYDHQWLQFSPPSLDEYATRYLQFFDAFRDVPRVKYEQFVADPVAAMDAIARALDLPPGGFDPALIPHFRLSGDSGRKGDAIGPRTRRPTAEQLLSDARSSASMRELCMKLDYPLDVQ